MLIQKLHTIKRREILGFLVGGGSAVLVDYTTYHLMMYWGVERSLSKAISYVLGAVVGFVINKFLAFESRKFSSGEIVRYVLLYALSAIVNTITNSVVLMLCSWSLFAFLCATGVSTILNFLGQKFYVFRKY